MSKTNIFSSVYLEANSATIKGIEKITVNAVVATVSLPYKRDSSACSSNVIKIAKKKMPIITHMNAKKPVGIEAFFNVAVPINSNVLSFWFYLFMSACGKLAYLQLRKHHKNRR